MNNKGKLYLLPVPLGEEGAGVIPAYVQQRLGTLEVFIAERARTARRYIKSIFPDRNISDLTVFELDKHQPGKIDKSWLAPAAVGKDIGLLSEAGCPGVADPGAKIVALAHQLGIEVVPMVGPSSILLALMAAGMNGQQFCFQGYLSSKKPDLGKDLKRLEQLSAKHKQTQIFIETPYRNTALIETALNYLAPNTLFCIAADLTLPTEYLRTMTIKQWKQQAIPDFHKRPAIFLIYSQ